MCVEEVSVSIRRGKREKGKERKLKSVPRAKNDKAAKWNDEYNIEKIIRTEKKEEEEEDRRRNSDNRRGR